MVDVRSDWMKNFDSHPGMAFSNRMHQRSFTLNIFQGNSRELIAVLDQVTHQDLHITLFDVKNRQASLQIFREIVRLFHNFLTSAMTLVEHTRNFMKEY